MTRAYLSIGSNIDPFRHIPSGLRRLRDLPGTRLLAESAWYRTAPWMVGNQPDFINLAVALETDLSALALLGHTQAIETSQGRARTRLNGPRTLDIDLLLHGDTLLDEARLRLPHPGLLLRDFMLLPLLEIAPDARYPGSATPLGDWVGELRYHQIIERLGGGA